MAVRKTPENYANITDVTLHAETENKSAGSDGKAKDCLSGKILVIDDDPVIREILKDVLTAQGHVVTLAADLDAARDAVFHHGFDLIFLDIVFPDQQYSGFDILKCIRKHLLCPVVLITSHPSTDSAITALRDNVFDYLKKPLKISDLEAVTQRALQCQVSMDETRSMKAQLDKNLGAMHLTDREKDILGLFARGFSYAEAAQLLGCKVSNIQMYAKRIYKKLGVHSRAEAVHEALCLQLIES